MDTAPEEERSLRRSSRIRAQPRPEYYSDPHTLDNEVIPQSADTSPDFVAHFNAEETPEAGWGISSLDVPALHDFSGWTVDDGSHANLTSSEREALEINGKHPPWLKAFGLWNVTSTQLLDSSWKPPPRALLDDACMLIVMILCQDGAQRGKVWPFNFDLIGHPREPRPRLGHGIHCHYGYNESGALRKFHIDVSSFLSWKRHYIFGGADIDPSAGFTSGKHDALVLQLVILAHGVTDYILYQSPV